jgi:hypothetical protein
MNRTLSRTILGLLVLVAGGIVSGGAAPPPAASPSGAVSTQAVEVPSQCLLERNLGACVTCCIEAIGAPANVCSHFCRSVPPPLPGPEPQP